MSAREITLTIRDITEGRRTAGLLSIYTVGDVTVTLRGMSRDELQEWEWLTDGLALDGVDLDTHRLAMNGWKVLHGEELVGLLFQGAGTLVHAEVYIPPADDFLTAGRARKLRHGVATLIHARLAAGHDLPVDVAPEPVRDPEPARPSWYRDGTEVLYHGSLHQLRGQVLRTEECECFECDGYQLYTHDDRRAVVAHHVRHTSVTAVQEATDALVVAA
ncbi:hypothetical protein [Streptomyces sp. MNU103]|uniref:hypothetical protein n=1 Tax=Streptomyces sp. MNU103 TaxID=2560024 RepID=UPI001E5C4D63|nr:hypothetical protein [Streptomyces sp. MNU103]